MKQRVKMFVAVFLAEIKKRVVQLWLLISNSEYRTIVLSSEYRVIRKSGVFDNDYYVMQNPDLIGSYEKPLVHYIRRGKDESTHVSIYFDRDYYLSQLPPGKQNVTNPLAHFLQEGWLLGKKPNPLFHTDYYLDRYPGVLSNRKNPLTYYLKRGWKQEHCTSPEMVYLAENNSISALIKDKINPLGHFLKREPYSCFDSCRYLDQIPGLTKFTDDYWGHYLKYGASDGKSPVVLFDPLFYRQDNPEIDAECLDLYPHYQSKKRYERVRPSKWFDPVFYMEQVTVKERQGMTPLEHYLIKGVYERRYTDERIAALHVKPLISIIVPVYNVNPHYLNNCIRSVLYQTYPHWELCLADDCSTDPHVRTLLRDWKARDDRIKVVCLEKNNGISKATTRAIELAEGEYFAFLDNDDELTLDALYHVVGALHQTGAELIYSDEDLIGDDGSTFSAFYKPDYNPELLLSHNYITHLLVTSADLFDRSGGLLKEMDGAQDFDLVLKLSAMATRVHHIAKVLYHWRASETSTSVNHQQKQYADIAGKHAVEKALVRMGREGEVLQTDWKFYYHYRFKIDDAPLVSIISVWLDTIYDGVTWIEALCRQTAYINYEILIVLTVGNCLQPEVVDRMREVDSRVRIIFLPDCDSQTSLYNSATDHAEGEYFAFISPNIEVYSFGWLEDLLQFAQFEDTGFAGGRIEADEDIKQRLSTLPDVTDESSEYCLQWLAGCSQHMNGLQCNQEIMLVTGELCLVRRSNFKKYGGLQAKRFPQLFAFADLSMKFRDCGLRNIYAATCLAKRVPLSVHNEEVNTDKAEMAREHNSFQTRWRSVLQVGDPFYNSGCLKGEGFSNGQFDLWYLGA